MEAQDLYVDGNAAAGSFAEVFAFDITSATATCSHCGVSNPFAKATAFVRGPGTVLRCSACSSVLARFVKARDTVWLDLSGTSSWQITTA